MSQNLLWDWRCATTFKTYLAEEWERRYTLLVLQGWCCVTETLAWPSTGNNIPRRLHTEAFYRWCPGHTDHTCHQSYLVYTDISQCRGHTEGTRIPRDYSHKLREKGKLRKTVRNEEHFEQRAQHSELKANEWKRNSEDMVFIQVWYQLLFITWGSWSEGFFFGRGEGVIAFSSGTEEDKSSPA